jgi:hypothetical protein
MFPLLPPDAGRMEHTLPIHYVGLEERDGARELGP